MGFFVGLCGLPSESSWASWGLSLGFLVELCGLPVYLHECKLVFSWGREELGLGCDMHLLPLPVLSHFCALTVETGNYGGGGMRPRETSLMK